MLLYLLRRPYEERIVSMDGLVDKRTKTSQQDEPDHSARMIYNPRFLQIHLRKDNCLPTGKQARQKIIRRIIGRILKKASWFGLL